jgi:hypothetical protein
LILGLDWLDRAHLLLGGHKVGHLVLLF